MSRPAGTEPPANPKGGKTLVVDSEHPAYYPRPSAALKDAGPDDQVFVRPGRYEDKIFVAGRPIRLIGAGRDEVQIFSRRGGPFYLQQVSEGLVSHITFRYIGSDPHSAMNVLDSSCTISSCRIMEGILSGIVIYGPEARPSLSENEVCYNRESGIFAFAGARPYLTKNLCHSNHHFGIAARDHETRPDIVRNVCRSNMLSGILLFHYAEALLIENECHEWGLVMTPDCTPNPPIEEIPAANDLSDNPRGTHFVTREPLSPIGR